MSDDLVSLRTFALGPVMEIFTELGLSPPQFLQDLSATPASGDLAVWDIVGISDYNARPIAGGRRIEAQVMPMPGHEPALDLPGGAGLSLVLAAFGEAQADIKESPSLALRGPELKLRLPESLLKGKPAPADPAAATPAEIEITGIGELCADTAGNVDLAPAGPDGLVVRALNAPWEIGDSGFKLDPGSLKIELQGKPEQFRVSLTGATLTLPPDFEGGDAAKLSLETAAIDRSGFSGRVAADLHPTWDAGQGAFSGAGSVNLAGIGLGIQRAMVQFDKNVPTGVELRAEAALPFFDGGRPLMTVGYGVDKALSLGVEAAGGGALELKKDGVATFAVKKVGLRIDGGKAELTFSGDLKPEIPSGLDIPEFAIEVENLKLSSEGKVALQSGWVVFQPELSAGLSGFALTLYKVGIGTDPKLWLSLDGKVALVDGLPSAEVKGLRIVFDPDAVPPAPTVDFGLEGIYLDASIAEVALIRGGGRLIREPNKSGFAGDMLLGLPQLGFALDVSMLAGINTASPPFPFFYLAVGVDLPAAIPLGQSGLGLFGAQGLLGINVYPSFSGGEGKSWYYDWYKAPPVSGVTHSSKWVDRYLGFALGAGVTLCTADGFTVLTRSLLVLALPGPLLLVEGRAAFLSTRSALGENPPLRALMILDLRSDSRSIQLFIEAQYEFVEGVLFAHGVLEVYSELKANPNWYIYLGRRSPREMRIQAEILKKLFRGDAYFQIQKTGIDLGASIGYKIPKKRIGPVSIMLDVGAEFSAGLSFDPEQLQAVLHLWGKFLVKVFGAGLDLSIDATAEARVPTPWWLSLHFQLKLGLPWPLPDLDVEFERTFEEPVPPAFPQVLGQVQALAARSQETWDLAAQAEGVPMDAKICLAMAHRAANRTAALIGGLESGRTYGHVVGDYTFEFALQKLDLRRDGVPASLPLYGMWQADPQMQPEASGGTLILNSKTAFVYSRWLLGDEVARSVADGTDVRPARSEHRPSRHCLTFGKKLDSARHWPPRFEIEKVQFRVRQPAIVIEEPADYCGAGPLRGGLNVISAYGADFRSEGKRPEETRDKPRSPLSPVVLEIRWPQPVHVVRMKAQADRVLAGLRGDLFAYGGEKEPALDRLYLIGTLISVQEICTVSVADAQGGQVAATNRLAGDRLVHDMGLRSYWEDEEFVFAPHTRYTLEVGIDKERRNAGVADGTTTESPTLTFTTGGTPDDLTPYLRAAGEPSPGQPSAGGGSGHAGAVIPPGFGISYPDGTWAPIYGADPVGFFFNAGYVRKMYELVAGEKLEIAFLDASGQEVKGRVTEWAKAATRADGENVTLSLGAANRSLPQAIAADGLPCDDVLLSRPAASAPAAGRLLPGQVHTVQIRCVRGDGSRSTLFQTQARASLFATWQELFNTLNRRVSRVDSGLFGGTDLTTLLSLDEAAALPLVGAPLPAGAVVVVIHDAQRSHDMLLLELPEPLPREGMELTWLDAAGAPLSLQGPLLRSDRTRFAWHGGLPAGVCALRIRRSRPGALVGEPATVSESLVVAVEMEGGTP